MEKEMAMESQKILGKRFMRDIGKITSEMVKALNT